MNKIRGSFIAKGIAWLLCIGSVIGTAAFGFLTLADINGAYYHMTLEEMLADAYRSDNAAYSEDAYQNMKYHKTNKNLTEEGFRYGIFQTEDLTAVNFRDKTLYMDTNMTEEDFKNLDEDKIFLYQISESEYDGWNGSAYGYVSDWDNMLDLQTISSNLEEQDGVVWKSQYADAVCFDTAKGIFYYRSEAYYYPVQFVSLFYTDDSGVTNEYCYVYDFEKGKYWLNYSEDMPDDSTTRFFTRDRLYGAEAEQLPPAEEIIVSEINEGVEVVEDYEPNEVTEHNYTPYEIDIYAEDEAADLLRGDGNGSYVDFCKVNQTAFSVEHWGKLLLDDIREIDGKELTLIDSETIDKKYFVTSNIPGYYLDDNYTLHVAQPEDMTFYWVASLIPDINTPVVPTSRYYTSTKLMELFFKYGESACSYMIAFAFMTIVSFAFLVYACGYRRNREEIVLTWFDRLPLEVLSVAAFFAELVPMSIAAMIMEESTIDAVLRNITVFAPLALSAAVIACALALWYVLSLCVRMKCGKWWRNTICYKIWSFFKNAFLKVFRNLNLLWKLLLFLIAKAFVELFVLAASGNGMLILLWLGETALLGAAAVCLVLQMNELQKAAEKMADGNLAYKVQTDKFFLPCKVHGENLNKISSGLSKAVDERMKSERFKTELITNVSHDIKTPLTSIINYVDLLEKEELHNEKAEEYLAVLERQSSKLKKLIEDLVEASKASTGNLEVGNELLEAGVFLTQTVGEFEEKLSLSGLELIVQKPEEALYILADGRHLWRVVDNLMNNICKYAQPSSRVYVNLEKEEEDVVITFRNISKYQLNINGGELMERFVRGDSSRNTEGHGLGLSIAKSLVDLIGGQMQIVVDGDLFKVILRFQVQQGEKEPDEPKGNV